MTSSTEKNLAPLEPGRVLGILGGGQLGRMFAIAARRLGYRVHVFVPDPDSPTGQVSDQTTVAPYDDLEALERFADHVDRVTFEFENIPTAATSLLGERLEVRPSGALLHQTQHRLREKNALTAAGVPTVAFAGIQAEEDLGPALEKVGLPAILKTAAWGYDGKGQSRIETADDLHCAWHATGNRESILEAVAPFECEVSVVAARGANGQVELFEPSLNLHERHILDVSVVPAGISADTCARAQAIAAKLVEVWDVVGVLCVEMFVLSDGSLLVNEIAPRPHNSGHLTIEAYSACQFEQQVRAVAGLPLAQPRRHGAAAMANLLGDLWSSGEPNWSAALSEPVSLHLYGKHEPRPGRKMGHLTAVADDPAEARAIVERARRALTR